jgi:hypothetical protein
MVLGRGSAGGRPTRGCAELFGFGGELLKCRREATTRQQGLRSTSQPTGLRCGANLQECVKVITTIRRATWDHMHSRGFR